MVSEVLSDPGGADSPHNGIQDHKNTLVPVPTALAPPIHKYFPVVFLDCNLLESYYFLELDSITLHKEVNIRIDKHMSNNQPIIVILHYFSIIIEIT